MGQILVVAPSLLRSLMAVQETLRSHVISVVVVVTLLVLVVIDVVVLVLVLDPLVVLIDHVQEVHVAVDVVAHLVALVVVAADVLVAVLAQDLVLVHAVVVLTLVLNQRDALQDPDQDLTAVDQNLAVDLVLNLLLVVAPEHLPVKTLLLVEGLPLSPLDANHDLFPPGGINLFKPPSLSLCLSHSLSVLFSFIFSHNF